jgi:hypothetical protein
MEIEDSDEEYYEEYCKEGEVNYRVELISALEQIRKQRKTIKSLKAELKRKEVS